MNDKRLFGLIGHPLSHSFSSKYFNEKFRNENLLCEYLNFDLKELIDPKIIKKENPGLTGLNITIPYKSEILNFLDEVDSNAKEIGAVNVIQFKNERSYGYNTDYLAFTEVLPSLIDLSKEKKALILGTGGASKAISYALEYLGIPFATVSRAKDDATYKYSDLSREIILDHTIIVNSSPVGNYPNINEYPEIPYEYLSSEHLLYDLTYNPKISAFLSKGLKMNCLTSNGYSMLVKQAELSWEIWNQ